MAYNYGSVSESKAYTAVADTVKISNLRGEIGSNLQLIQNLVTQLESQCKVIGGHSDSPELRNEIDFNSGLAQRYIESTKSMLTELNGLSHHSTSSRLEVKKLFQKVESAKLRYEDIIRKILTQCKYNPPPQPKSSADQAAGQFVPANQEQLVEKDIDTIRLSIQSDVTRQIEKLASDLEQVSDIFVELHEQVLNQGEQVDNIVDNVEDAYDSTNIARNELHAAIISRRKAFKKKCILSLIVITVLAVIVLVLVLVLKPSN